MIDGRTGNVLARLLAHVEQVGGEVVLTKDKGRWQGQVIVGATAIPTDERLVAYGYGTLFEALHALLDNLGVPGADTRVEGRLPLQSAVTPPGRTGRLSVGQQGARPASTVSHRPFADPLKDQP